MEKKKLYKIIGLITYTFLVLWVTRMPSLYTHINTTAAYCLSMSALFMIIWFLNSRPIAQTTLLNRLLVLFLLTIVLTSTRYYLFNFLAHWCNLILEKFVDNHQSFSILFLPLKSYSILVAGSFVGLCTGRLLLVLQPAVYHMCHPSLVAGFIGSLVICISVLDKTYSWFSCRTIEENHDMLVIVLLKEEFGLQVRNSTVDD